MPNDTPKKLTHYIGMNGSSGCLPDSCDFYENRADAVISLTDLLELSNEQTRELDATGYVSCTAEQGADYAEITECSCITPWEHSEYISTDEYPADYVKVHVQTFLDTLKKHKYQDKVIEHSDACQCFAARPWTFYCEVWIERTFYILPYASFGDYDNSTAVERSNARQFKEEFPFVSSHGVGYGEYTGIDETDIDAITWDQLENLKETCKALENYPVIDEEDMSRVETELQDEAWSNWACSDFQRELKKHFLTDDLTDEQREKLERQIDELDSDTLREMLEQAANESNTYWEIECGGNAHIDFERLISSVELPSDESNEEAQ